MPTETYTATQYLLDDQKRTLFPLNTTQVLVSHFNSELLRFAEEEILARQDVGFLPAIRCYASKQGYHLRRTVKLDPVAEAYLYHLVFKNRRAFRGDHSARRISFGYRFTGGKPEVLTQSYASFKKAVREAARSYKYAAKFDIANYFNNIYHHDLIRYISTIFPKEETDILGVLPEKESLLAR